MTRGHNRVKNEFAGFRRFNPRKLAISKTSLRQNRLPLKGFGRFL
jgi:hypothetical protein